MAETPIDRITMEYALRMVKDLMKLQGLDFRKAALKAANHYAVDFKQLCSEASSRSRMRQASSKTRKVLKGLSDKDYESF